MSAASVLARALLRLRRRPRHRPAALGPSAGAPDPDAELAAMLADGLASPIRADGDLHVTGSFSVPNGLIVKGTLRVDPGAELDAPAEVFGDVELGAGARSRRPLIVHGAVRLGKDATLPCCQAAGDVHLGVGARVDGELRCAGLFLEEAPDEEDLVPRTTMLVRTKPPARA